MVPLFIRIHILFCSAYHLFKLVSAALRKAYCGSNGHSAYIGNSCDSLLPIGHYLFFLTVLRLRAYHYKFISARAVSGAFFGSERFYGIRYVEHNGDICDAHQASGECPPKNYQAYIVIRSKRHMNLFCGHRTAPNTISLTPSFSK